MRARDVALALLVVVLWGLNFAVIKLGLRGVSPFVLAGLRFVFASFPAVLLRRRPERDPLRAGAEIHHEQVVPTRIPAGS